MEPDKPKGGPTKKLLFAVAACAIGSGFQHGYNTGVVNAPYQLITNWIAETKANRTGIDAEEVSSVSVTLVWSTAVSIFCVGGMIGGTLVGVIADSLGRKRGLLFNNILVFISTLLFWFCKTASSYEMLILGRFVIGVNCGLNAGLAPMYLAEISPTHLRGAMGSIYQLVITISILISQVLGLESLLGTEERWPLLLAVTVFGAVFQVFTLTLCPETPKHILMKTGDEAEAKRNLEWLRGSGDVSAEMEEMVQEREAAKLAPNVSLRTILTNPVLRIPLIISVTLMIAQQLSGINAVFYFSTGIFEDARLSKEAAQYATLSMGALNVAMTIVSVALVERAGRKTLLLVGFSGMFVSSIFLTICLTYSEITVLSYISIVLVLAFVVSFAVGPGSIPWFMVSELFSQSARPTATSVAVPVNWAANFLVGLGFLPLKELMGSYVFIIFIVLQSLFILFIYKKVPETKNKTIEEITSMFRQSTY